MFKRSITLVLAVTALAGCNDFGNAGPYTNGLQVRKDSERAYLRMVEESADLQRIAMEASRFADAFGCAPGTPHDLLDTPSDERLKALGCRAQTSQGIDPKRLPLVPGETAELAKKMTFIRRWDGIYVIEWPSAANLSNKVLSKQCTFYEAEQSECPSLRR